MQSGLGGRPKPLLAAEHDASHGYGGRGPMDRVVLELAVVCLAACAGLALAWAHEADYFAMFFAIAAAISGVEAIRRSL